MSAIQNLQNWYFSECNGDWEHTYGVTIRTLDNPGWIIDIELKDTSLENKHFKVLSYGTGENSEPENNEWIHCKVENNIFKGAGGPYKLEEIINVFLSWANEA